MDAMSEISSEILNSFTDDLLREILPFKYVVSMVCVRWSEHFAREVARGRPHINTYGNRITMTTLVADGLPEERFIYETLGMDTLCGTRYINYNAACGGSSVTAIALAPSSEAQVTVYDGRQEPASRYSNFICHTALTNAVEHVRQYLKQHETCHLQVLSRVHTRAFDMFGTEEQRVAFINRCFDIIREHGTDSSF